MAEVCQGVLCHKPATSFCRSSSSLCSVSSPTSTSTGKNSTIPSLALSSSAVSGSCRSAARNHSSLFGNDAVFLELLGGSYATKCLGGRHRRSSCLQVRSAAGPNDGVKWWEKDGGPNLMDVHSSQELTEAVTTAGDKLVVVEFFASWCGSCRALYPKLCKLAAEHRDIVFLKVNFDENKPLCKSLNIRVLPYFHLYRGAAGLLDSQLDSFSCSIMKLQRLKDAIAKHNAEGCNTGPEGQLGDVDNSEPSITSIADQPAAAGSTR